MTSELDQAAEIAEIALQYRQLLQEGAAWAGGPASPETIKLVADAMTQSLDAEATLRGVADSSTPEDTLRGLLAIIWAQGFNVGTMYAERQGKEQVSPRANVETGPSPLAARNAATPAAGPVAKSWDRLVAASSDRRQYRA
ncbi:hypothetical protein MHW47_00270 [Streptomyces sp. OfavH-34-F]|uniref:hypothetical protein n=1 Tax=Streptomyces sp. OfavH-34-F TaxID=2917760 RepID=UPI001EF2AB99|nr:hypothetical protein [Streptomyces sp. OfavH-34-F]MCG7522890.1 hypothetical protein [Streptomyces sp. OfavH-34-F]